jgi:hypothetical protein
MNAIFRDIKVQLIPHRRHLRLSYRALPVNAM